MAEETGNVTIGVNIDVDKANERIDYLKKRIKELTDQWGSGGSDVLEKVVGPLKAELADLEEQLNKVSTANKSVAESNKEVSESSKSVEEANRSVEESNKAVEESQKDVKAATDETSTSFKKHASGLNNIKDVTEFAGAATKKLGLDETALGDAINETTGYIGSSITFIKKGAAAMDAMKIATNGATGAVNKFKAALTSLAKHPILIALAAIAAAAAAIYTHIKKLDDYDLEARLGKIDRSVQLLNEKLQNELNILNALGAKQSTITQRQIDNLKKLNTKLGETALRYKTLWNEMDTGYNLDSMARDYLNNDNELIDKLSDNAKELVKRYAEAKEEIRKNNIELKTMENITLKINLAEEAHELTLRKINLERDKGITSLQKEANAQGRAVQRYNMLANVYERIFKYSDLKYKNELKAFQNEQAQSVTTIKMLNEEIKAIEQQKKANGELVAKYRSAGAEEKAKQLLSENDLLAVNIDRLNEQIKSEKALIALRKEEKALNIVAEMNEAIRKMDLSKVDEAIQSFEYLIIKGMRTTKFENFSFWDYFNGKTVTPDKVKSLYNEIYQTNVSDFFDKATSHLGDLSIEMTNFVKDFDKQYTFLENRTGSFSERIKDEFNSIKETLESKDITEEQRALLTDRLTRLKNAYQEYNNISSQILNNIQGVTLSVFETVRNSSDAIIEFLNTNIGKNAELIYPSWFLDTTMGWQKKEAIESVNNILPSYSKSLEDITKSYENVAEALRKYNNGSYTAEEITETLNENEKALFISYKELGIPAYTELLNLVKELTNEYKDLSLAQKETSLNQAKSKYEYTQAYQSLGDYTLSEMERYAKDVIDAESDYYDELYKVGGVYYDKLLEAGLANSAAEQILAEKRYEIEEELIDKKRLINQQYQQTIVNATADTMNDIQSIMDVAFEDNKQVRGATLMVTTLADAAAAYTSVFAQAPGGVAAKTAQAVIASTAVMARGIASYNSLMNMTTSSGTESLSAANSMANATTATGVDTTSVARTLIGSRYAGAGETTQYVLVTDEVTARQKQAQGARRLETI